MLTYHTSRILSLDSIIQCCQYKNEIKIKSLHNMIVMKIK